MVMDTVTMDVHLPPVPHPILPFQDRMGLRVPVARGQQALLEQRDQSALQGTQGPAVQVQRVLQARQDRRAQRAQRARQVIQARQESRVQMVLPIPLPFVGQIICTGMT